MEHIFRRGHSFCMFALFNDSYGTTATNSPETERMFEENFKRKWQFENYSKISQQKDSKETGTTKKGSVSISYNRYFKVNNPVEVNIYGNI